MTLSEAQAQRDAILSNLGLTEVEFQNRRMQYSSGDARLKELAYIEDLITRLTAQQNGGASVSRSTLASFKRG